MINVRNVVKVFQSVDKFFKFSENIEEASKYIEKERDKALKRIIENGKVKIDLFLELDSYIQKEILYYIMADYYQDDLILLNDKHIELLLSLISSKKANMEVNLPNEIIEVKSYNEFYLKRETEELTTYEIEFNEYVELPNKHSIKKIEDEKDNSNNICRLSSEEVALPLIVRTRKLGDRMEVKGMNGRIKEIFIENKIDLHDRDLWPIITDSLGRIVWIPGLKKSKFDRSKNENCDIIIKYY